jgi:thiol-disulfide isomerase/thioredoxin
MSVFRLSARQSIVIGSTALALAIGGALALTLDRALMVTPPELQSPAGGSAATQPERFAFAFLDQPRALPEIRFVDGDGRDQTLASFRGRPILLNIWATWCIPCRKEMPTLDHLQALLGPSTLLVLPLSIDRQGGVVVRKFYQEIGLEHLGLYVDQSGKSSRDLAVLGVPTTLLIDKEGREIGRKIAAAEWDSPAMLAIIQQHIAADFAERGRQQ